MVRIPALRLPLPTALRAPDLFDQRTPLSLLLPTLALVILTQEAVDQEPDGDGGRPIVRR